MAARAGGEAALAVSHSAARVGGSPLPCARHFLWGTFLLGGKRENKKTAADNTLIHYTCPPVLAGCRPPVWRTWVVRHRRGAAEQVSSVLGTVGVIHSPFL